MIPDKKNADWGNNYRLDIGLKFSDFIFERLVSCNCSIILFGRLSPITTTNNNNIFISYIKYTKYHTTCK